MTKRPTRSTTAGRIYLDLQKLAQRDRRPTDELFQLYTLEGFLNRLSRSSYTKHLILKGGVLLATFGVRRPTRDIDFQGVALPGKEHEIKDMVCEISQIRLDDGLLFDSSSATTSIIREQGEYPGVRISLKAVLASAKSHFHIDINIGDPVSPPATQVTYPQLLGGEIQLLGYPLAMVLGEKIVTAVSRGTVNTRWRDFADIYILSRSSPLVGDQLMESLSAIAIYRSVELEPLNQVLKDYENSAQGDWSLWRRKQKLEDRVPESFKEVLQSIFLFVEPALSRSISGFGWDPSTFKWE
jgi:Nucleotidyl transferase AbiEii toxin, Type IV TA system